MTNEIQFLQDQVASEEVWKADHDQAMKCTALQEKIKVGLSLFGVINGTDMLWSRRVQSRTTPFDEGVARGLYNLYKWWISPCNEVFAAVSQFESDGYQVDGAPELRKAYATAKQTLRTNIEEVIGGFKKMRGAA